MEEKLFWRITRGVECAVLTCPHCRKWFDIPNAPGNAESYHFCPGCGWPVEVADVDKYLMPHHCNPKCEYLAIRQEEYDDDMLGFCHACEGVQGKLIGLVDDVHAGKCECVLKKG